MAIPVFVRERTVRFEDTDELGHVNNVVWLRFVVALAHAHTAAVGIGDSVYEKYAATWVVRRHRIDYLRSAVEGEVLRESTRVVELRGARCVRVVEFRRACDESLLVRAESVWAFVDRATQRPRRMPPEVVSRLEVVGE